MEAAAKQKDFSKGPIKGTIIKLAIPMMVAQLAHILYSIVDRMYLGHVPGIGRMAITGVGITLPIISIIMAFANLFGTGGSPLCAIYRGRGENEEAEGVIGNCFTMLLITGAVLTAVMLIGMKDILYWFGADGETYPYAAGYMEIYTLGTPFVMLGLGMNPFINSQGFTSMGMVTVGLGAVTNIILDPIFIFTLDMGVAGAALATVISQAASAVWALFFLTSKQAILRLRLRHMRLKARRLGRIVTLGLSGFIMSLTNSLIQAVCNTTLLQYGGNLYVGVITVINTLREVITMFVTGLNNGTTPFLGYNYGAGKYQRVTDAIRFSIAATVVYAAVIWAVVMLIPGTLIRVFNNDDALITAGIPAMRIYFALFIFMSLQFSSQTIFLSLGKSKQAIFFSLLRKAVIAAPLTVLLPLWGLGTDGVFYAEMVSQLIGGLACSGTMYFTVYRRLKNNPRPLSGV